MVHHNSFISDIKDNFNCFSNEAVFVSGYDSDPDLDPKLLVDARTGSIHEYPVPKDPQP
jgi:hypothetical protein